MVSKHLGCLTANGNYSKERIGCFLLAMLCVAVFACLMVIAVILGLAEEPGNDPTLGKNRNTYGINTIHFY